MRVPRLRVCASILFLGLTAVPPAAQTQKGGSGTAAPTPAPSSAPSYGNNEIAPDVSFVNRLTMRGIPRTDTGEVTGSSSGPPLCFHWPVSGTISARVSTIELEVPDKAYKDFEDACSAVTYKNWPKAEEHLEKAVQTYPKYVAAWVLLGQVQRDQQKLEAAAKSCQQALAVDSRYLLPYLCLADLAARSSEWDRVATLTDQVLAQHPVKSPGAYYYNSLANLNLHQLPEAEKSGLRAAEEGMIEQKQQSHWLLAKIYEQEGNRALEANQLHEYLKLKPQPSQAKLAREVLRQIEERKTRKK